MEDGRGWERVGGRVGVGFSGEQGEYGGLRERGERGRDMKKEDILIGMYG